MDLQSLPNRTCTTQTPAVSHTIKELHAKNCKQDVLVLKTALVLTRRNEQGQECFQGVVISCGDSSDIYSVMDLMKAAVTGS